MELTGRTIGAYLGLVPSEYSSGNSRVQGAVTKTGLMLGLGERADEVLEVMSDLRTHHVDILTLGQYLRPSPKHLPIVRYVTPEEFNEFRSAGIEMGSSLGCRQMVPLCRSRRDGRHPQLQDRRRGSREQCQHHRVPHPEHLWKAAGAFQIRSRSPRSE